MEILGQVKEEDKYNEEPKSRIRELIRLFISNDAEIKEINVINNEKEYSGFIEFSVSMDSIGLNALLLQKYKKEIFTRIFVDFASEFLIRENIDLFLKEMSQICLADYSDVIGTRRHENSGMYVKENNLVFTVHMSIFQDILVSDFKRKV